MLKNLEIWEMIPSFAKRFRALYHIF